MKPNWRTEVRFYPFIVIFIAIFTPYSGIELSRLNDNGFFITFTVPTKFGKCNFYGSIRTGLP